MEVDKGLPPTGQGPAASDFLQSINVTRWRGMMCSTQVLVEIQKPDLKFEYPDEDRRTALTG